MQDPFDDEAEDDAPAGGVLRVTLGDEGSPRLDKALAAAVPEAASLSRSRLMKLIEAGAVFRDGQAVRDPKARAAAGEVWEIHLAAPEPVDLQAEAIPLAVVYEDADLIVIDKPAGMVVHPAPGSPSGTLVNALMHHCGDTLSGIGGERRPGIVHRIDKDTTGLLVAAKSDRAHHGLAAQFEAHTVTRHYLAVVHGVPSSADPRLRGTRGVSFEAGGVIRIATGLARHRTDRQRQAVVWDGQGRHAITRCGWWRALPTRRRWWIAGWRRGGRIRSGSTWRMRGMGWWATRPMAGGARFRSGFWGRGRRWPMPSRGRRCMRRAWALTTPFRASGWSSRPPAGRHGRLAGGAAAGRLSRRPRWTQKITVRNQWYACGHLPFVKPCSGHFQPLRQAFAGAASCLHGPIGVTFALSPSRSALEPEPKLIPPARWDFRPKAAAAGAPGFPKPIPATRCPSFPRRPDDSRPRPPAGATGAAPFR